MKKIAILPLRKGSKGIPQKNKRKILGRPLYQWILGEAIFSDLDEVYVFTDDEEILDFIAKEYTWTDKVIPYHRSEASATDTASSEQAMIELSATISDNCSIYCMLQATSPVTEARDINRCLERVEQGGSDSALTVVETKRFLWSSDGKSINYDFRSRPRRQDFEGLLVENGAVYAVKYEIFIENNCRLGGKVSVVNMDEDSLYEIDEPTDFLVVEQVLHSKLRNQKRKQSKIKAIVLDVDGVLSDGTVLTGKNEELAKAFSLRDGMGMSFLKMEGIVPIVMTSENSEIVHTRINKLGVDNYYPDTKDKYSRLCSVLEKLKIERSEVAYVGDDINDLANMLSVGWSFCPNNSVPEVKNNADIVLNNNGGDMAVREAIEFIISFNKRS